MHDINEKSSILMLDLLSLILLTFISAINWLIHCIHRQPVAVMETYACKLHLKKPHRKSSTKHFRNQKLIYKPICKILRDFNLTSANSSIGLHIDLWMREGSSLINATLIAWTMTAFRILISRHGCPQLLSDC